MKHLKVLGYLAAALALVPTCANAELAYAAKQVHLRAGPAIDYPVIATLMPGVVMDVQACLSDYRWCDVIVGQERGWVYAGNIVYTYQGSQVPVLNYGALIGIGIVAFSLGSYWDSHYVGRPWYPQRPLWIRRLPPPRLVPEGHRPPPPAPPGHRPHGGQRPHVPEVRPPGAHPPGQPGVRPPDAQRPAAPVTQPPIRPPRQQPAERPQGRPQPAQPQGERHQPQREQGSATR